MKKRIPLITAALALCVNGCSYLRISVGPDGQRTVTSWAFATEHQIDSVKYTRDGDAVEATVDGYGRTQEVEAAGKAVGGAIGAAARAAAGAP